MSGAGGRHVEHGQAERGGLAGAGARQGDAVAFAAEQLRNHLRLDRHGGLEPQRLDGAEQFGLEAQFFKTHDFLRVSCNSPVDIDWKQPRMKFRQLEPKEGAYILISAEGTQGLYFFGAFRVRGRAAAMQRAATASVAAKAGSIESVVRPQAPTPA